MAPSSSASAPRLDQDQENLIEAGDLIDRLAHELRVKSNLDLPHAYFVEQVKITLAGHDPVLPSAANDSARPAPGRTVNCDNSVFRSWAMTD